MNAFSSRYDVGTWPTSRARVAELLARYPHVSKADKRKILGFMRTGRNLDIALLTSSERLRPNLDAFMKDHEKHFRVSVGEAVTVVALIAAFLLTCWLFWEMIGPGAG